MKNIPFIIVAGLVVWFLISVAGDWKKSDVYQEGWQQETERVSAMIDSFKADKGRYPESLKELLKKAVSISAVVEWMITP